MKKLSMISVLMVVLFVAANVFAMSHGDKEASDKQGQETTGAQQGQEMTETHQDQEMTGTKEKSDQEPMAGAQDKHGTQQMSMDMAQASELLGKNLVNAQGEELGEVQDLIVGKDGKIEHLVIARGGVLGLGEDFIAVPWSAAQVNFEGDQLTVNIEKEKLQQAPSFQANQWDEFYSEGHQQEVRGYYGEGETIETQPEAETQPGTEKMQNQEQPGEVETQQD